MDEATKFARQCMLDQHLSPATITGGRHIQQGIVVSEADVIPPLFHQQTGTIQPIWEHGELLGGVVRSPILIKWASILLELTEAGYI